MPDAFALASLIGAGIGSGFASGLFGVGGGIVRIPIFLVLFPVLGVESAVLMHLSAGTSLALAIPASVSAAVSQHRAGNLDGQFLRGWLPALAVGVAVGLAISRVAPGRPIVALFAVVVLGAAGQMLFAADDFRLGERLSRLGANAAAFAIGSLSTLIGLTGGVFTTPTLTAFGMSIHRAIATSSAGGVIIAAIGTAGYVLNGWSVPGRPSTAFGYVDLLAFAVMAPLVMLFAPIGVHLANRLDQRRLKRVFGVFLVFVALDMLRDVLFP